MSESPFFLHTGLNWAIRAWVTALASLGSSSTPGLSAPWAWEDPGSPFLVALPFFHSSLSSWPKLTHSNVDMLHSMGGREAAWIWPASTYRTCRDLCMPHLTDGLLAWSESHSSTELEGSLGDVVSSWTAVYPGAIQGVWGKRGEVLGTVSFFWLPFHSAVSSL